MIVGVFDNKTHFEKEIEGIGFINCVHKVDVDNIVIVHQSSSERLDLCTFNIRTHEKRDFVVKSIQNDAQYYFESDLFVYMEHEEMVVHNIRSQALQHIKNLNDLKLYAIKPKFS
jgi:hypothetical protein